MITNCRKSSIANRINMSTDMNKCRICLEKGFLTSIFNMRNSKTISTEIMCLAKIQIYPNDGLPSKICSKCVKKLDNCTKFIELCKNSDTKLRTLLLQCQSINSEIEGDFENTNLSFSNDSICKLSHESNEEDSSLSDHLSNNTINPTLLTHDLITKTSLNNDFRKNNDIKDEKKSKKQQCFTCGKVMSSRFRLKTHLRTHTGERPFSCPHCSKNFSLEQNLKVHLRTHTGEKPLQCSTCGAKFAQSAGLIAHRRKHTGQTPYHCTLCPRSFRTIGHLQYHIRRHTGEKNFECDSCGRAFITRSDLKQHLNIHTGAKPHVCCVCGLRLSRASHLRRHMRHTHDGEKPYLCTDCPSRFTHKGDFDRHKKAHLNVTIKENSDNK